MLFVFIYVYWCPIRWCSWRLTVTRRVSHAVQELLTFSGPLSSTSLQRGSGCSMSCFVDQYLSFCPFSFCHYIVCPSIGGFVLPLSYLQTYSISVLCIFTFYSIYFYTSVILMWILGKCQLGERFAVNHKQNISTTISQT